MKKLFAFALALAMLLSAAALAEAADYVGVWYLNEMNMEGVAYTPADFGLEMMMELKEDGTALGTSTGTDGNEVKDGSWTLGDEGAAVTIDGEDMLFVIEDGNLVADSDGMKMIFGREMIAGEVFVLADAKADAAEEDYAGRWLAFKMGTDGTFYSTSLLGEDFSADIDGAVITLNGIFFDGDSFETAFADGALTYTAQDQDSAMIAGVTAQLLEDGNLSLTLTAADPVQFIMQRVEEEEAE